MSETVPQIFDRDWLYTRRHRNAVRFVEADFLRARATAEIADRLDLVQRRFPRAALLGMSARQLATHPVFATNIDTAELYNDPEKPNGPWIDEEALALPEGAYQLVIFGWGLHLVNDLPGCLLRAAQALAPDGLLLACLPGGETLHELRTALGAAEMDVTGGLAPRLHPNSEIRDLGGLLQRAGLALPVADSVTLTVRYDNALALMRDLQAMGETNALTQRRRAPLRRDVLMRTAEIYHARYAHDDGRVPARFELQFLAGWAPHESQQKPLRPGSAKMRLADALGAQEISLTEDDSEAR